MINNEMNSYNSFVDFIVVFYFLTQELLVFLEEVGNYCLGEKCRVLVVMWQNSYKGICCRSGKESLWDSGNNTW